ncbi:MAG: protein-L-isoaspartate(D-aspartate) O-methyltransferase [Acidobacteriota bacterium]
MRIRGRILWGALLLAGIPVASLCQTDEETHRARRLAMVEQQLAARDITDRRVLEAMRKVPRHRFVPAEMRPWAYADTPLPIGYEQTISQPYIVALMTQSAEPDPKDRALEIGTGSGYQAAVLAELVREVYTIEIVPELCRRAAATLQELGYANVHVRCGDGYAGWPEAAPFDIILITAAAPRLPRPLIDQLAEDGRLVVPEGEPGGIQELVVYHKKKGKLRKKHLIPVRFVPMTGRVQEGEGGPE